MCYERELIEQTKKRFFMYLNFRLDLKESDKIIIKRFFEHKVNIGNIKNFASLSNIILYNSVIKNNLDKKQSSAILFREKII